MLGADRIRFVPLHSNLSEPAAAGPGEGYVLAAGRTLRDYPTLLRAAGSIGAPIVIIAGRDDLTDAPTPPNVSVLREVPRDAYLDRLRRCSVAVVPLRPTERATGQVVLLEALAMGKPVVATRSPGTVDYVREGETGLLVPPGDDRALAAAVRRLLDDSALAGRLSTCAVEEVRMRYTFDTHAKAKLQAIADLWNSRPPTT